MAIIDDAKRLATLSRNNPEFISKYSYTIKQLDNLCRSDDSEVIEQSKKLISQLSAKRAGTKYETVQSAYIQFVSGMLEKRKDSVIFEDVSISELIEARRVAYGFLKLANKTVSSGMHTDRNEFLKVYIQSLVKKYLESVKSDKEEQWDLLKELETVVLRTLSKHMLYREDISKYLKVFELAYEKTNKIYADNERYLNRMNLFDVYIQEDRLQEVPTINKLKYLFIKNLVEFKDYYKSLRAKLDNMLASKELTGNEYNYYNSKFPSTYANLLNDRPCKYYVPICAYQFILVTDYDINHMLIYTQEEMFTAYKFAFKFCKYYTNKVIEQLAIDYVTLQEKYMEVQAGKKISEEVFREIAKNCLDVLQKHNIITPMDYCKYADKYKLG